MKKLMFIIIFVAFYLNSLKAQYFYFFLGDFAKEQILFSYPYFLYTLEFIEKNEKNKDFIKDKKIKSIYEIYSYNSDYQSTMKYVYNKNGQIVEYYEDYIDKNSKPDYIYEYTNNLLKRIKYNNYNFEFYFCYNEKNKLTKLYTISNSIDTFLSEEYFWKNDKLVGFKVYGDKQDTMYYKIESNENELSIINNDSLYYYYKLKDGLPIELLLYNYDYKFVYFNDNSVLMDSDKKIIFYQFNKNNFLSNSYCYDIFPSRISSNHRTYIYKNKLIQKTIEKEKDDGYDEFEEITFEYKYEFY
jgi:hypothetical protein